MFRNWFSTNTVLPRNPHPRRVPARKRPTLSLERLEDRAVPATFNWTGAQNSNYNQAANWTDAANSSNHAVPTSADTAVILGSPNDPVMNQANSLANLQVSGGLLTISADLTVSGSFSQSAGVVAFGSNSNHLQIGGNVNRDGGLFQGSVGNVVFNGTAGQTVLDTSFHPYQNLTISNSSAAGVTLPGGSNVSAASVTLNAGSTVTLLQGATASFLFSTGTFTDNGKIVLNQLSPNGGNPTSLIKITGTLALSATSAFDLSVGQPSASAVYTFITYGSATGAGSVPAGNIVVHGNSPFTPATSFGATALTVTLTSPGIIDTWTGGTDSNFANGANWSAGVAPGAADVAVIKGAHFDPILSANATVGGLQMAGGFLTINANLIDNGTYSQGAGFIAFGSNANQLQIAGNVNRTGGVFLGAVGTVVFNGGAQSITDTSNHPFGWNMVVNNGTTLTLQPGSVLSVANNFTINGTVNLNMASPASPTPLAIGNNLVEGGGSAFNFTIGNTSSGLTYIFITFGGTETLGSTFSTNAGTVNHNTHNITVTT
jgi:hypothetical protein